MNMALDSTSDKTLSIVKADDKASVGKSKQLMRTVFFVPGCDERKLRKAATELSVEAVVLDFEDAVPPQRKDEARTLVPKWLTKETFGQALKLVRINSVESGLIQSDMKALTPVLESVDGIVLSKTNGTGDVRVVADWLDLKGPRASQVTIVALIETAKGMVNVERICKKGGSRVNALMFGASDFCADMGMVPDESELRIYRTRLVMYAKAYGLQIIDTPNPFIKDEIDLIREAEMAARMGFTGKVAIHPRQIEHIQKAFRPTEQQLAHARAITEASEQAGGALIVHAGGLVGPPMIQGARNLIARASH
eukprot:TRINITY_DN1953_c0_g1_i2.p1 TRINITY_DN1953_c0_g1~~TRINITY_DN1953_c0_g1_i2.p1  ORF type:complete len:309 (+),score=47.26 TRINITY_DN1953_c0_g1_i2:108-1034(+)